MRQQTLRTAIGDKGRRRCVHLTAAEEAAAAADAALGVPAGEQGERRHQVLSGCTCEQC